MQKAIACWLIVLTPLTVNAETVYVTERLPTVLRQAFTEGSPAVKTIEGGAQLEVLERVERFVRVRDTQGAEGWIEARWLANAPPARPQLERAQAELTKVRSELAAAQARVGQLEGRLSQEAERGAELAQAAEQARSEAARAAALPAPAPTADDDDFAWGWLVLAFAMLWIGFGAGVVWLRERHRKRLGGMYLRI